jgi:hypothetical protein
MRCASYSRNRRSDIADTRGWIGGRARGQAAEYAACADSTALGAGINVIPDSDLRQWYVGASDRGEDGKAEDEQDGERV